MLPSEGSGTQVLEVPRRADGDHSMAARMSMLEAFLKLVESRPQETGVVVERLGSTWAPQALASLLFRPRRPSFTPLQNASRLCRAARAGSQCSRKASY